ncbi:MAG: deoxyribose-phosphate aldolase [Phycisphaerae bacterium]|nr:deoxyribose-phosphate aldolase [Phycisphaerae bacterium]
MANPTPTAATPAEIAKTIDHALLKPTLTDAELEAGYDLAIEHRVASVCVMPFALARCAERLAGSGVEPSTVIGFPLGVHRTSVKVAEAEAALADGGTELDMVVNVSRVKSGAWDDVRSDVAAVLAPVRAAGMKLKVIFENCYLEASEIERLCGICSELRVDWVKTSTGFGSGGATDEDVALMRRITDPAVQVKASGGLKTLADVERMRALGCTRCGASSTAAIMAEALGRG